MSDASGSRGKGAVASAEDIEALVADFKKSGLRELHLRAGDMEIYLSTDPDAPGLGGAAAAAPPAARPAPVAPVASAAPAATAAPAAKAAQAAAAPAAAPANVAIPEGGVLVRAPYLGTFYRAPKPGAPPYVEIGQAVTSEQEICLVEVMKLFTAVRAGVAGKVHAILANDAELVEGDQPLFIIMPA